MKNNSTNFPFLAHIKWPNILKKHQKRHQTLIVKLNWTKVIAKRKISLWRKKILIPNIWSFQSWTKCWCYSVPKTNDTQILNVYNVGVRWSGTCARGVIVVNFLTYFIILNHANVVDIVVTSKRMFQEPGGQTFGAWKTLLHSPCWSASSSGSNHGFHKTSTACKNNLLLDDKINDIQIIFVCGSFLVQNNSQYYSLGLNWNENLFVKHAF